MSRPSPSGSARHRLSSPACTRSAQATGDMAGFRSDIAFFEEIRTWMARFDAEERRARGEAIPPDVELYLKSLTASAIEAGGVTDIYAAAGIGRPDLSHLDDDVHRADARPAQPQPCHRGPAPPH